MIRVLWVGRIYKEKRPELFLKLAKKDPEIKFWMIGIPPSTGLEYYYKIKNAASRIHNLEFIGFVPHDKINKYYAKSSLLINTSSNEGFPNTFLEAWGNYIPVITLGFDPDKIVYNQKLGFYSKTFDQMVEDLETLLKNEKLRKKMGRDSRKYVEKEHDVNKIVKEYERLIKDIVTGG